MAPLQPWVPPAGCPEQQLSLGWALPGFSLGLCTGNVKFDALVFRAALHGSSPATSGTFCAESKVRPCGKAIKFLTEGTPRHGPFSHEKRRLCSAITFIPDLFVAQATINQEYLTSSASLRPRTQKVFRNMLQKSRNLLKSRGRKARGVCEGTGCQSQAEIRFSICLPASAHPDSSSTWGGLADPTEIRKTVRIKKAVGMTKAVRINSAWKVLPLFAHSWLELCPVVRVMLCLGPGAESCSLTPPVIWSEGRALG